MIDALFRFDEIRFLSEENIRNEFLRITIDYREPGTLHLYHDAMALPENMIDIVKIYHKFFGLFGISAEGEEKLFLKRPRKISMATGNW